MHNSFHYFAYGSNMASARLCARIAPIEILSTARLDNHRLAFHKVSIDGSGKCDIVPSDHDRHCVHGVLYRVERNQLEILDRYEGVGFGYERTSLQVDSPAIGLISAECYIATETDPGMLPYSWYKEHVIRGAIENALPGDYIAGIEAIHTMEDPDRSRHNEELSIYDLPLLE